MRDMALADANADCEMASGNESVCLKDTRMLTHHVAPPLALALVVLVYLP
jgi:hypothetical protein